MSFKVLFVCTGNVCRSPMAHLLFQAWVDPRADVTVSSAGTHALVGHAIDRSSASALGQLGVDPSGHRATQFDAQMARDADLILTAAREHRDLVITEVPAAFRRTFTMKEFARLADGIAPASDPAAAVVAVDRRRGESGRVRMSADDMPDPYRGDLELARDIAGQVTLAVRTTLDVLGFSPARVRPRPIATAARRRPAPAPTRPRPYPSASGGRG